MNRLGADIVRLFFGNHKPDCLWACIVRSADAKGFCHVFPDIKSGHLKVRKYRIVNINNPVQTYEGYPLFVDLPADQIPSIVKLIKVVWRQQDVSRLSVKGLIVNIQGLASPYFVIKDADPRLS